MPRPARSAPTLLVLLLASACSIISSSEAPPAPDVSAPTRRVLPNGVRVLAQEFAASEVVALQLWVRVGGRDEALADLGLAHYLEHLLFQGTVMRPAGFVHREVESVGGEINARTSFDYTYFHAVLPPARATAGIEMLADISVNSTLDPATIDLEKPVVLEEMRRNQDSPHRFMLSQLHEALFDGHPYGRPLLGTPEIVRGLTRETLMSFYRSHYVPESFVLVVVGPVKTADVLATAERTFGRLPRSGQERLPIGPPVGLSPKRLDRGRPGAEAYLGFAWLGPKLDHADTPGVDLLISILGRSPTSRFTQSLRERLALVSAIDAGYAPLEAAGIIWVIAQVESVNLQRAEAQVLNEIRRVRDRGVSDVELRRAVTVAEARQAFALETAEGRARALGRAETVWRLEEELAYVDRLRSVTRDQIRAAARRYLDLERYSRVAFVPPAQ
jgi:zinc protease